MEVIPTPTIADAADSTGTYTIGTAPVYGGSGFSPVVVATSAALTFHTGNTSNPHATTAAQVGALPLAGGTLSADGDVIKIASANGTVRGIIDTTGGVFRLRPASGQSFRIQNSTGTDIVQVEGFKLNFLAAMPEFSAGYMILNDPGNAGGLQVKGGAGILSGVFTNAFGELIGLNYDAVTIGGTNDAVSLTGKASATFGGTVRPGRYTVATLPTPGTNARVAYATDARVSGEGVGAGTGSLVTDSGTAWRIAGTNITAAA